jgi:hypothetical protein
MINSPDGKVTESSRALYNIARQAAERCSLELGSEIALMGSAGWGAADEASDIDLAIWGDRIPPVEAVVRWLEQCGVTDARVDEEGNGGGELHVIGRLDGVWLETTFYTLSEYGKMLAAVLAGESAERAQVIHAWNVVRASPLRTQGVLAGWQQQLAEYPEALRERIITTSTAFWRFPHRVEMLWTLARRATVLGLNEWLSADLEDALRILFAVNRQWEPDWKNLEAASRLLARAPEKLVLRVNEIFISEQLEERVALAQQLMLEILELVPQQYDTGEAAANIRASIRAHVT